jgi:7-cyano-7-deazaguanine synthase in queuosine biosynthesis
MRLEMTMSLDAQSPAGLTGVIASRGLDSTTLIYRLLAEGLANEGCLPSGFRVLAPFLGLVKADIVRLRAAGEVPLERTWSCYRGGAVLRGKCGTCTKRRDGR